MLPSAMSSEDTEIVVQPWPAAVIRLRARNTNICGPTAVIVVTPPVAVGFTSAARRRRGVFIALLPRDLVVDRLWFRGSGSQSQRDAGQRNMSQLFRRLSELTVQ